MVDLHAHLPQLPNAGLGAGLDLLTWLERYIFPLERAFDAAAAERLAPAAWRAFAGAGTTTAMVYGAVYEASLDATFRAAEAHGIRAIVGKVMMDRGTYDPTIDPKVILDQSLAESARLIDRWHGADDGRLRYAVTPRFAITCTADLLRESAALAAATGAYWQTHVSEDRGEIAEVARLFPDAHRLRRRLRPRRRARGADRPRARRPSLRSGAWSPHRDRDAGRPLPGLEPVPGVGDDAAGPVSRRGHEPGAGLGRRRRPGPLDLHGHADRASTCRTPVAWPASRRDASSRRWTGCASGRSAARRRWVSATITGSLEAGKEADVIAVDPAFTAPVPGVEDDEPADIASRMIFRSHPDMVRAAWVRGRRLEGPGELDDWR